jgi:hypothetical protein
MTCTRIALEICFVELREARADKIVDRGSSVKRKVSGKGRILRAGGRKAVFRWIVYRERRIMW